MSLKTECGRALRKRCEPGPTRRAAKGPGCRFRAPFLWLLSFGEAKESNYKTYSLTRLNQDVQPNNPAIFGFKLLVEP